MNLYKLATILAAGLLTLGRETAMAQDQSVCFSGTVRPACSGFILFEGSAVVSAGATERTFNTSTPTTTGPIILVHHVRDLTGFFSGSLGYVRVTGSRTAVGAVGELGFSNTSELGNAHRVAATVRVRRWYGNGVLDIGAGPLGVQVFRPASDNCCGDKVVAYGGTLETAFSYRSLGGITLGADAIHGAGRTSAGLHAGVRVGSYGAVAAAVATAALGALVYYAVSHSEY